MQILNLIRNFKVKKPKKESEDHRSTCFNQLVLQTARRRICVLIIAKTVVALPRGDTPGNYSNLLGNDLCIGREEILTLSRFVFRSCQQKRC